MAAADPCPSVGQTVNHDVAARIHPARLSCRGLFGRRIPDPQGEMIAARRIVHGNGVKALGDTAVACPLLWPKPAPPERDAELADDPAVAIDRHPMLRLVDIDAIDRAGGRGHALAGAIVPRTFGYCEAAIDL